MMVYLEVGTADFDTLNQLYEGRPSWRGMSVEAVPQLFRGLSKLEKNKYVNAVASADPAHKGKRGTVKFHHVPEEVRQRERLDACVRGMGSMKEPRNGLKWVGKMATVSDLPARHIGDLAWEVAEDGIIDLVKIDVEGYDAQLLDALLESGIKVSKINFEFRSVPEDELQAIKVKLGNMGYAFIREEGDNLIYEKPSVLILAQRDWSTGSIVRDLSILSEKWVIKLWHWSSFPADMATTAREVDVTLGMTLTTLVRVPWARAAGICNMIEEIDVLDTQVTRSMNIPLMGGISRKVCSRLAEVYPAAEVMYLPGVVRMGRFTRKDKDSPLRKAGFVGLRKYGDQFFEDIKRPGMFLEICKQAGLEPVFTEQDYTYDNIEKFYHSVDMVICTSVNEGGPLGLFEAIACGTPVISTPVGVVAEIPEIRTFCTVEEAVSLLKGLPDLDYNRRVRESLCKSGLIFEASVSKWEKFFERAKALRR